MEDQLRVKFRKNWSTLKDELSARWKLVADVSLENGILDFDHLESIRSLPVDSDKAEAILLKVVKLRLCELFLDVLEEKGFGRLCDKIKETDISLEDSDKGVDTRKSAENQEPTFGAFENTLKTVVQDLKQNLTERDEKLNDHLRQRDEQLNEHLRERDEHMNEQFRQYIDERLSTVAVDNKRAIAVYESCVDLKENYTRLQSTHQQLRKKINGLTLLAQEKTKENSKLMKQVGILEKRIKELEESEGLDESHAQNLEMIQSQKTLLWQLEAAYREKDKELTQLKRDIDDNGSTIAKQEEELSDAKDRIEQLRKENANLLNQHDHEAADKANTIMVRLEQLIREHDMGTTAGLTGKGYMASFSQRGTLFTRRH